MFSDLVKRTDNARLTAVHHNTLHQCVVQFFTGLHLEKQRLLQVKDMLLALAVLEVSRQISCYANRHLEIADIIESIR